MRKVDVIVCGAGLSGCVAAALFAKSGKKVLLIDRFEGSKNRIPESWLYHEAPSITELELDADIRRVLSPQRSVIFSSLDAHYSIEVTSSGIWSVDRNKLDQVVLQKACSLGVETVFNVQILDFKVQPETVSLEIENKEGKSVFEAEYFLDATGKTAFLSEYLKLPVKESKLDNRVAYFSHFQFEKEVPQSMRLIAMEGGYLFSIPVSKNRVSIGCVLSESHVNGVSSTEQLFTRSLNSSSYLSNILKGACRVLPVISAKNQRRICMAPSGPSYRIIGEAAAFFDPFFCPGIDFAFFSAEQAVSTIENKDVKAYENALLGWISDSENSAYSKIGQSQCKDIMRLFADPHLPWAIPAMLTQSFCRVTTGDLQSSISEARRAYEMAHD